jgi:hypothetical protein
MNTKNIIEAKNDWDLFKKRLGDSDKRQMADLSAIEDHAESLNLVSYIATNDQSKFDSSIHRLPKQLVYQKEFIPVIVKYYLQREMHEVAFKFICDAEDYLRETNQEVPVSFTDLKDSTKSKQLIDKIKVNLSRITEFFPKEIPLLAPRSLNGGSDIETFILAEIVQGLKVIHEKVEAVRMIPHENRLNDYLQAILTLRFPLWGWSIQDQARVGKSPNGGDAGEADLLIKSVRAETFALIEALIFNGKKYNQNHILKCPYYNKNLDAYFIIVYYKKKSVNFGRGWNSYKGHILTAVYPKNIKIDKDKGFEDLSHLFSNNRAFKIQRTFHNSGVKFYHIMTDFGD